MKVQSFKCDKKLENKIKNKTKGFFADFAQNKRKAMHDQINIKFKFYKCIFTKKSKECLLILPHLGTYN